MTYHLNVFKYFTAPNDHLFRIDRAETIKNIKRTTALLIFASILIYGWMAYLGIGSTLILDGDLLFTAATYESSKFWFIIGRAAFGGIYAAIMIFVPAFIFRLISNIDFSKLVVMQLIVFLFILVERLTWIPLAVFADLDWFVSPLSLGVLASYVTTKSWVIYFFGSITIFQVLIMMLQIKFICYFLDVKKGLIGFSVFLLHFVEWWLITLVSFVSVFIIDRWFL
ncbi:MAG TPA: hypothetical protein VK125_04325 [Bacillota bacterium]|nr:hypothetical protein [Bacillota bacterium]